jgi:hypothetical protein
MKITDPQAWCGEDDSLQVGIMGHCKGGSDDPSQTVSNEKGFSMGKLVLNMFYKTIQVIQILNISVHMAS